MRYLLILSALTVRNTLDSATILQFTPTINSYRAINSAMGLLLPSFAAAPSQGGASDGARTRNGPTEEVGGSESESRGGIQS